MLKKRWIFILILGLGLVGSFQNCTQPLSMKEVSLQETSLASSASTPVNPVQNLMKNCDEAKAFGKLQTQVKEVTFENPNQECPWGQNGNLDVLDGYIRARTEQYQTVTIPSEATVCQIKMSNMDLQDFWYDDNLILTLNNYVLSSTTDFSRHLQKTNGFPKYSWSRLINKPAQNGYEDSTNEKQYCAGKMAGLAKCSFPQTDTHGNIALSFDEKVMQTILGMTTPKKLELGVITTGDNDSTDCQHVPLKFLVEVEYY